MKRTPDPIALLLLVLTVIFHRVALGNVPSMLKAAEPPRPVSVRPLEPSEEVPPAFRFMVDDFHRSGGRGRIFVVQLSEAEKVRYPDAARSIEGPYLFVDELPQQINIEGKSVFTRDPVVLEALTDVVKSGIRIILQSTDREDDGRVYGDDELRWAMLRAGYPGDSNRPILGVSPSMTRDILIHEGEHLQQHILGHPLQKILSLLEKDFDIEALRVLQNVIGETMSYRSQMNYLNLELRRRTSHILTVTVAPDGRSHSVNPTKFGPYLERRKQEVRVGAALSFRMLIPIFKSTDNDTAICGVIRVLTTIARGIRELELALADSTLAEIHGCPKIEKPPRARLSA